MKEEEVANHPSALKRIRQNRKRRLRNKMMKSMVKTHVKKLLSAIEQKKVDEAKQLLQVATSILHKSASKGVYHPNKAARQVSKLAKKVNALVAAS